MKKALKEGLADSLDIENVDGDERVVEMDVALLKVRFLSPSVCFSYNTGEQICLNIATELRNKKIHSGLYGSVKRFPIQMCKFKDTTYRIVHACLSTVCYLTYSDLRSSVRKGMERYRYGHLCGSSCGPACLIPMNTYR